jgi:outer membrane protein assembly factor BamA
VLPVPRVSLSAPKIEIQGNRSLSGGHIEHLMEGVRWDGGGDQRVLRGIQEAYIREGYLSAKIRLRREVSDSTVVLIVDEGEPARMGEVEVIGAERFGAEDIKRVLSVEKGTRFRPTDVDRGVQELLEMYDAEGYPFAQVWIDSLALEPVASQLRLTVYVVEGVSKRLSQVHVEGLEKTKEEVAIKLSGLRVGEPYDGDNVRDAYLRLSASGVFEDVAYPTIQISPQGQGVEALIRVVESKQSNSFTAALGYAEREGAADRVLSGVVRLDLLNIGGKLRDLGVFWRNDGAGRVETELTFRQQFFLGKRMSLGLSVQQVGQDTVYTWQSLGVETGLPVGRLWQGMLGFDFAVNGDRNTFAQGDVTNSLRYRLTAGYTYKRGRKQRGTFFALANRFTYANKKQSFRDNGAGRSVPQYITALETELAVEVGRRIHVVNRTAFHNLTSGELVVPLSEQFYLGGAATLRGYRENQFHSPQIAYARNEFLVGKSRAENGYVFADVGYFLQRNLSSSGNIEDDARLLAGYGFGLRTQSRAGNVDISFAVGEELSLQQTKIHIILNRSF